MDRVDRRRRGYARLKREPYEGGLVVAQWLAVLPPQSKHRVRLVLRGLAKGQGDIKGLQGPLEGFNRLRIGGRRIIYRQISRREILLEFANTRDGVYELFEQILARRKTGRK